MSKLDIFSWGKYFPSLSIGNREISVTPKEITSAVEHLFKERLDCLQRGDLALLPMEEAEGQTGQWKGRQIIHIREKNTEYIHYYKNIMPLTHLNKRENEDVKLTKVSFSQTDN